MIYFLENLKAYYSIHKGLPNNPILSQLNSVHMIITPSHFMSLISKET